MPVDAGLVGARLAGEGVLERCGGLSDAFAGKPGSYEGGFATPLARMKLNLYFFMKLKL
jgi:hypothetical protein